MKIIKSITILTLLLTTSTTLFAEPVIINNKQVEIDTKLINNRKLVLLRQLGDNLGIEIDWDSTTGDILASNGTNRMVMNSKSNYADVDGEKINLEVPPTIIDGKTYLPLRFVAETFGYNVGFSGEAVEISVKDKEVLTPPISTTPPNNEEDKEGDSLVENELLEKDYELLKPYIEYAQQMYSDSIELFDLQAPSAEKILKYEYYIEKRDEIKNINCLSKEGIEFKNRLVSILNISNVLFCIDRDSNDIVIQMSDGFSQEIDNFLALIQ